MIAGVLCLGIPSPKPQPAWRSLGDLKACSFLEGQGLKLLLFSLHSPEHLQCQVQRRGIINRGVHSGSLLKKGRAELPWNGQGPLVAAPLWPHTLVLCLLPCGGDQAEDPSRHSACPSEILEEEAKGQEPVTRDWPVPFPKKCSLTSS